MVLLDSLSDGIILCDCACKSAGKQHLKYFQLSDIGCSVSNAQKAPRQMRCYITTHQYKECISVHVSTCVVTQNLEILICFPPSRWLWVNLLSVLQTRWISELLPTSWNAVKRETSPFSLLAFKGPSKYPLTPDPTSGEVGIKVLAAPIAKKPGVLMNVIWMRWLIIERFLEKNTSCMIQFHLEMFSRKRFDTNTFSWAGVCF